MRVVLAGQPNCGKSTLFNAVAGPKAATANFPGTSVKFVTSKLKAWGYELEVVDLPGLYSLTTSDEAEREAARYLLERGADVIINVIDATRLGRSLELTLQLLELQIPLVVALNMYDEAQRKGMQVNVERLSALLGVPVVATVARRGLGLRELFLKAVKAAQAGTPPPHPTYDKETEEAIAEVVRTLEGKRIPFDLPLRFVASKLLERDPWCIAPLERANPGTFKQLLPALKKLEDMHGWDSRAVISGHRHAFAHSIEEKVVGRLKSKPSFRDQVDRLLLHPVGGFVAMAVILAVFFLVVFQLGKAVEEPLVALFEKFDAWVVESLGGEAGLLHTVLHGVILGISGGVAIVLPYLVPFLAGLALLEDSGYLPRVAYLLDSLMHKIGLHGKSVLPMVLGLGCTVPALMATRILENRRDRRLTAALVVLVPCSARTTIIFGLVAAFVGPWVAASLYGVVILVLAAVGTFLSRRLKGPSVGLILEIPDLRPPSTKAVVWKVWIHLKEFVMVAWPLLVLSSAFLSVVEWAGGDTLLNGFLKPFTSWLLGLPAATGVTLVFGVMRKELALVMLVQALGTAELASVMTPAQMVTFTLFVVFYVPCVASIAALAKELGWKDTLWVSALSLAVATIVAVAARVAFALFGCLLV